MAATADHARAAAAIDARGNCLPLNLTFFHLIEDQKNTKSAGEWQHAGDKHFSILFYLQRGARATHSAESLLRRGQ